MLVDVTLRAFGGGRRRPPPLPVRQSILDRLTDLRAEEVELSYAGGGDLPALLKHARSTPHRPRLALWTRCTVTDVRAAAQLGPDRLAFGVSVADGSMSTEQRLARGELARTLRQLIALARREGAGEVTLDLEDIDRAEVGFALYAARVARENGASRIRLCDSLGQLAPAAVARLVELFRQIPVELAVRCHDDFGLGTANALTALLAGADLIDVAVLGAGGRGGLAHLEQVASYLACVHDHRHLRLEVLSRLVEEVRAALGPARLPAGAALPSAAAALQMGNAFRDPLLHQRLRAPDAPGEPSALGEDSSVEVVVEHLRRLGLGGRVTDAEALAARVREAARLYGRPLRETELVQLLRIQMSVPARP